MARREEIECPNCGEDNDEDSKYCKKCGTNLRSRRYSKDDDPIERLDNLEEKVDKILTYVEEDDDDEAEKKKRRRTPPSREDKPKRRGGGFFGR